MKLLLKAFIACIISMAVVGSFALNNPPTQTVGQSWSLEALNKSLIAPADMKQLQLKFSNIEDKPSQIKDFDEAYALGIIKSRSGDLASGTDYFNAALKLAPIDSPEAMASLRRLTEIDAYYSDVRYLMEHGERLRAMADRANNDYYSVFGYKAIAEAHLRQGKTDEVIQILNEMSIKLKHINMKWPHALVFQFEGFMAMNFDDYENAEYYFHQADEGMKDAPLDDLIVSYTVFRDLMDVVADEEIGQMDASTAVIEIQKLIQRQNVLGKSLPANQILMLVSGRLLHEEGKYGLAEVYLKQAMGITKQLKHSPRYIKNDWGQQVIVLSAVNAYALGDYRRAADYFENSVLLKSGVSAVDLAKDQKKIDELQSKLFYEKINLLDSLAKERADKIENQKLMMKVLLAGIVSILLIIVWLFMDYRRISDLRNRLYLESVTDPLTRLFNRRKIMSLLECDDRNSGVIALLDIDHFKDINDTYGHQVGDEVLQEIAATMQNVLRGNDYIGRFGGEEFLILLLGVSEEQGLLICERVRTAIEQLVWPYEHLVTTVSIGATVMHGEESAELIREADLKLYQAKSEGRNRVIL